jgi:LCP family protein required for cell wall assembly
MADGPGRGSPRPDGPDEPDFDWLYGRRGGRGGDGDDAARDPEPTRVLPTMRRSGHDEQTTPVSRPVSPPPAPRPRSSRRAPRPRLRWLWLLLLLWVVFLLVVPLLAWSRIDRVDASPSSGRPAEQKGTTYLLVGSDSREGLTRKQELKYGVGKGEGRRTDSILLLHTGSGPNLLMSIPRDSLVDIPGYSGARKINAAFAYGGPKLLVRTIEKNTGIRVDDYVEIGFAGFVDVVNAVGGIRICPEQAMDDPQAGLHVKAGCQHANGRKALGYARSRHTSGLGDIARAQHQREVVSAVGRKAVSPWSVINPVRYVRLNMAASRSLRIGEDTGMLATMKFAYAMTRVTGKNGLTCGVPISDLAVHWDPVRSEKLFHLIAEDRTGDVPRSLCRPSGLPNG